MKSEDAIRIVREAAEYGWNPQCLTCEIRHEDRPNLTEAAARLEADAQALADVRTLVLRYTPAQDDTKPATDPEPVNPGPIPYEEPEDEV